eukprot:11433654-Alexandrium_andersonii.AAC.1
MGISDFRRLGAAERAVWRVGRAGTTPPSGWISGPELILTRGQSDRLGVPTCETFWSDIEKAQIGLRFLARAACRSLCAACRPLRGS